MLRLVLVTTRLGPFFGLRSRAFFVPLSTLRAAREREEERENLETTGDHGVPPSIGSAAACTRMTDAWQRLRRASMEAYR